MWKSLRILFLITINVKGQTSYIEQLEDSIQSLFNKIKLTKIDNEKLNFNSEIEKPFKKEKIVETLNKVFND